MGPQQVVAAMMPYPHQETTVKPLIYHAPQAINVDHSDVVGASPFGTAATTSSFSP